MSKDIQSKVIKEEVIYEGKWLGMKYVDYTIGDKTVNNYQKVYRTTNKDNQVEGIDIVPIVQYKDKKAQVVLNVEFRAPVHSYTLAFPTGMTQDKNYEQNAKRQLLEETGYVTDNLVKMPNPVLYYDPWKSSQNCYHYVATINGDDPNHFKGQSLEQSEHISVVKFQLNQNLLENIINYCKEHDLKLESKVYTFCLGLWFKNNLSSI